MARVKRKRKLGESEVPLSAMIDIVFLLLIYFIVTQKPIIEDMLLYVQLPNSDRGIITETPPLFIIDVWKFEKEEGANPTPDKFYYGYNSRKLPFKELKPILVNVSKQEPQPTIIVNCGPNAPHGKLVLLLDLISELKLEKINLTDDYRNKDRQKPPAR